MTSSRPRKRFGQHFLHDQNVIARIIHAINPETKSAVIEIGPGLGALTLPLLQQRGDLHVVEIDRDLAKTITERCQGLGALHMHCTDALEFDFHLAGGPVTVVGNLPYNISTPLIFHLLDQLDGISEMIFMLQEEVVDRMHAGPGTRTYGRLSVMVQSRCRVEKLFTVGAHAFSPPPKVESAVVRLTPLRQPPAEIKNHALFSTLVRDCFNQRRKTLRNALKHLLNADQIREAGIDPQLRPEQLTITQFIHLANLHEGSINQ